MKRRWFSVVGVLMLVAGGLFVSTVGFAPFHGPYAVAGGVCFALATVLLLLAGVEGAGVAWHRLAGAAHVLLGLMVALDLASQAAFARLEPTWAVPAAVGACYMVAIGVDWLRGGPTFDPDAFETGPLLGS